MHLRSITSTAATSRSAFSPKFSLVLRVLQCHVRAAFILRSRGDQPCLWFGLKPKVTREISLNSVQIRDRTLKLVFTHKMRCMVGQRRFVLNVRYLTSSTVVVISTHRAFCRPWISIVFVDCSSAARGLTPPASSSFMCVRL